MTFSQCSLRTFRKPAVLLLLATASAPLSARLHAQAGNTASRGADISVFAGAQIANPDYGPDNAGGVAFGLDYTRFLNRTRIQPSLELRVNANSNSLVHEDSFLFGLRAGYPLGRVVPYVDFLIGPGTIHFPQNINYTSDNSIVYNFGGGIDFAVTRHFDFKLDLQGQHWNTGEDKFTPSLGTVGVVYHIPFRKVYGQ